MYSQKFASLPPSLSHSRHSDERSSLKKIKLNNSQSISTKSFLSEPEFDAARRAASSRVLNIWSSLEQKYARRLDEDDVIDLQTGSIVKDRGVLSSSNRVFDFGCFSEHDSKTGDIDNEETDEEDELGGWGFDQELDQQFSRACQPVRTRLLDPADAGDLQNFLTAEKVRKRGRFAQALRGKERGEEWGGSNHEEEEGEDKEKEEEEQEKEEGKESPGLGHSGQMSDPDSGKTPVVVEDMANDNRALCSSDESDDELAGYDATVGEGAMLWEVERSPDYSHPEHADSVPPEPPFSNLLSTGICVQVPAHPQTPLLTPHQTSTFPRPTPKTPRSVGRHETDMPATTLTPITQRLFLKGKRDRTVRLSPNKKLVPEVVVPIPKTYPLRLNTGKIPRKENPQSLDKRSTSNAAQELSADRSQDSPKFTTSIPTQARRPSSRFSVPSQENKPRFSPPTEPPATPCVPAPPYVYPSMPSYFPYVFPDWSMHHQQIQQLFSAEPRSRFHIEQALLHLRFLSYPVQIGDTQVPWPYPLSPSVYGV